MKNKTFYIIGGVIILLVIIYFLTKKKKSTSTPTQLIAGKFPVGGGTFPGSNPDAPVPSTPRPNPSFQQVNDVPTRMANPQVCPSWPNTYSSGDNYNTIVFGGTNGICPNCINMTPPPDRQWWATGNYTLLKNVNGVCTYKKL